MQKGKRTKMLYLKVEGTLAIQTQPEHNVKTVKCFAQELLGIEQYLNNEVATALYKKYKVGFRVHLKE